MLNANVLLPRLGVNVDHVATLRQQRHNVPYPSPATAAAMAELAGAAQITIHLREDRRHIQDDDLAILRKTVTTRLNLEMAATEQMVRIAFDAKPEMVTLVPERREELTTEGGLNIIGQQGQLKTAIGQLKEAEIAVSLFVDPDVDQVNAAYKIGADAVELHTGAFCEAKGAGALSDERARLHTAAKLAQKHKLGCYAGHGITYDNVQHIASITEIEELNIGHAIVCRAVLVGMEKAVREMRDLAQAARRDALAAR